MLTPKQRDFCRHHVANGFNATQAAISAEYARNSASVAGSRLLKQRRVREEVERLQAGIARAGNLIMSEALAGSAAESAKIDPNLAKAITDRRDADDEARAVVSMAYVMAGMIDGFEMALGRRAQTITLRKTKVFKDKESGEMLREETTQEVKVFQTDLSAAKSLGSELAKIVLPAGDGQEGQTIEGITKERAEYMDKLLEAYTNRTPLPPPMIVPRQT